jgi:hypothetical protein
MPASNILLTKPEDFAADWLHKHCQEQPAGNVNLTWFVACRCLYAPYLKATYLASVSPISTQNMSKAVQQAFPRAQIQWMHSGRERLQVYTGIRFYIDKIDGRLTFGL